MGDVDERVALVEGIARVMTEYRLDAVVLGDLKISKSHHEPSGKPRASRDGEEDEDLIYASAGA